MPNEQFALPLAKYYRLPVDPRTVCLSVFVYRQVARTLTPSHSIAMTFSARSIGIRIPPKVAVDSVHDFPQSQQR